REDLGLAELVHVNIVDGEMGIGARLTVKEDLGITRREDRGKGEACWIFGVDGHHGGVDPFFLQTREQELPKLVGAHPADEAYSRAKARQAKGGVGGRTPKVLAKALDLRQRGVELVGVQVHNEPAQSKDFDYVGHGSAPPVVHGNALKS